MSVITIAMGRLTKDPVMQKSQNSNTEYMNLDLACTQRGQNNENETMYYQCHFNSFLAQRLIKANVKKGSCLVVYGDLELHPFIYNQGNSAGQAGINAAISYATTFIGESVTEMPSLPEASIRLPQQAGSFHLSNHLMLKMEPMHQLMRFKGNSKS